MDTIRTRPRIEIEPTPPDKVVEATALAGVVFLIGVTVRCWPLLPQTIPSHFDIIGKVDGWGPKSTLLAMPILGALSYVLLSIVSRFPYAFNYPVPITEENAERQYRIALTVMRWLKMEIIWLFAYLNWQMIQVALGRDKGIDALAIPIALAAILGTSIVLVVKAYRAR